MQQPTAERRNARSFRPAVLCGGFVLGGALLAWSAICWNAARIESAAPHAVPPIVYQPRQLIDSSGYGLTGARSQWPPDSSLSEIHENWDRFAEQIRNDAKRRLEAAGNNEMVKIECLVTLARQEMAFGRPAQAHELLQQARAEAENCTSSQQGLILPNLMFFQGVAGLRLGENENCIMCRGESSCILPISPAAVHQKPNGSRLAIQHFTEYLNVLPDDLEVRWLLNLAHMTLGEYPNQVEPRFLVSLDRYSRSEVDIGKFRDVGHLVGVNRFNQAGGAIMDDFDNDGLLDLVVTSFDPKQRMGIYRNTGDGRFEELGIGAGVKDQLGGLNCVQGDYNNDGLMDIYIPRGAWLESPVRPTLLRNEGGCQFTDVTEEAGMLLPANSNAAQWADYDNDGWLDLFVCCEKQAHHLFRNLGNGKFEEVASKAGVAKTDPFGKGCAWIDYDNDDYPDLFVNCRAGLAQLFHNNRDGTFENISQQMGIDGPEFGFSCWAWDYNNDGWLDIFATCYQLSVQDVVRGLIGEPHELASNRLFLNHNGQSFEDVTKAAGLDMVFATMGSNFGDFDNDGFLDFYLGTGELSFSMLVPNRMFKNMAGRRFAEITGSAGVGHLQKGHGVACGDWNRDGNVDILVETGGAVEGDRYHNVLFQNPGHDNSWVTLKLIGEKTNRCAIGARIRIVTEADEPLTTYRHVSSGSSFGANPLEQTIGLAKARKIARLEVHWPSSGTTQVFRDVDVNQSLEITEFADEYRKLNCRPIALIEP